MWDRPRDEWPRDDDGRITMGLGDMDVEELLNDEPA